MLKHRIDHAKHTCVWTEAMWQALKAREEEVRKERQVKKERKTNCDGPIWRDGRGPGGCSPNLLANVKSSPIDS